MSKIKTRGGDGPRQGQQHSKEENRKERKGNDLDEVYTAFVWHLAALHSTMICRISH